MVDRSGPYRRDSNSTDYVHPNEENLFNLHKAMEYNSDGKPIIRTSIGGESVTITGNVSIPGSIEISNDIGNPIPTTVIQPVAVTDNGGSLTVDGTVGITGDVNVTQGTDPWIVGDGGSSITVDGTVGLDSATLAALENTTVVVDNEITVNDGGGSITIDGNVNATVSGTVSVDNFPASQTVNGTVGITGDVNVTQGTSPWEVTGTLDVFPAPALTYLRETTSVPVVPIIQVSSYEGLRERDIQTYSGLGGSITENSDILVSCSSTVGSYGVYRSRRFIPYRTGQSNVIKILGKFDTPAAGTQQRMGVANQESGYYIGYNGTDFQFLHSYGGVAEIQELTLDNVSTSDQTLTITLDGVVYTVGILNNDTLPTIASKIVMEFEDNDAWQVNAYNNVLVFLSGSLGNKTGTFSLTSTGNVTGVFLEKVQGANSTDEWIALDSTPVGFSAQDYNNYMFKYSWLGISVYVFTPNGWYLLKDYIHTPRTELPVAKPIFKITTVAYNTGGASGVTLHNSGMYGAVEGIQEITGYTNGGGTTRTGLAKDVFHHIMSIQNPYVNHNNNRLNLRSIRFMDLSVAAQSTDPVEIYIFFNQNLATGNYFNWASVSGIDGLKRYQESRTDAPFDVTADAPIIAFTSGLTGSGQQYDLLPYNLILPPGTHMSLVAKSTNSMSKLAIAGTWGDIG